VISEFLTFTQIQKFKGDHSNEKNIFGKEGPHD
jgi:hypothetical protein